MRKLSTNLETHLSQNVTTLCTAWRLELSDGRIFGFSEHDQDLIIGGLTYLAQSSLNETESESRLGFAADNGAVQGVLDAAEITEADIGQGVLKGARLSRLKVNWADPTQYVILSVGELGQVTTKGGYYEVEWLGVSSRLDRSTGRVFSKKCEAALGDARCGVDVSAFPEGTYCPKTLTACRDQFDNAENFRGFPYLIGDDTLYAGPIEGARKDGGSRYQ